MRRSRKRRTRAGHLDTRIVVYQQDPDAEANEDGEIPEVAKEVCRRWAEEVPLRGRLKDLDASQEANVTHVLRTHYDATLAAVTPEEWVVVEGTSQRLNIVGVIDLDNRHRTLEIECTERLL